MKYKRRPEAPIEAMQWDGTEASAEAIREALGANITWDSISLWVDTGLGHKIVPKGGYIFKEDNAYYRCSSELFHKLYEPA